MNKIKELNETAASGVQYKVFFLGRHGEGYRTFLMRASPKRVSRIHGPFLDNVGEDRYPNVGCHL